MKLHAYIVSSLLLIFLVGCGDNTTKSSERTPRAKNSQKVSLAKVDGYVIIMQNTIVPENAVLTVTLADTSIVHLPALILSQKYYYSFNSQSPIPFELTYHDNEIRTDAHIVVSASVSASGKLLYESQTATEVINNGVVAGVEVLAAPVN